jgi:hypothetical protein
MGWYMIDPPGTRNGNGPCKKACKHADCVQTRKDVAAPCRYCGKPIGYGNKYYLEDDEKGGYLRSHFVCLHVEAEKQWKAHAAKYV